MNVSVIPALVAEPAPGLNGGISQNQAQTLVQDAARLPRRGAAMTVSVVLQGSPLAAGISTIRTQTTMPHEARLPRQARQ